MDVIVFGRVRKLEAMLAAMDTKAGSTKILVVAGETAPLSGGATTLLSLDLGSNNFLIKSIYIESASGARVGVDVLSSAGVAPFKIYENAVDGSILYDVVDLPYTDADAQGKLHCRVKNMGQTAAVFKIRVAGIAAL